MLADCFRILLRYTARNLQIVRFQHDRAGWFDKHQLPLVQAVGAIQIDPFLYQTKFDMQLPSVWLLARGLFEETLAQQLSPNTLSRRPMVFIERHVRILRSGLQLGSIEETAFVWLRRFIPVERSTTFLLYEIEGAVVRYFLDELITNPLRRFGQLQAPSCQCTLKRHAPRKLSGLLEHDHTTLLD